MYSCLHKLSTPYWLQPWTVLPSRSLQLCHTAITRSISHLQMSNVHELMLPVGQRRQAAQRHTNLVTRFLSGSHYGRPARPFGTLQQELSSIRVKYSWAIRLENSFAEKVPAQVDKLTFSQQHALTAKRANRFLSCISCIRWSVTSRSRERILSLCSVWNRYTWNAGASSEQPSTRETGTYWINSSSKRPERGLRDKSTSHTRGGWESWRWEALGGVLPTCRNT